MNKIIILITILLFNTQALADLSDSEQCNANVVEAEQLDEQNLENELPEIDFGDGDRFVVVVVLNKPSQALRELIVEEALSNNSNIQRNISSEGSAMEVQLIKKNP
ncbi:MAG: hypothetical protein KDD58_05345 [Bdellovibrionales bacterium]|nr:hypothetical protein [Bdellovibrionales bacterium]